MSAPCRNFFVCGKPEDTDEFASPFSSPGQDALAGSDNPEGSTNPIIQTMDPDNQRKRFVLRVARLISFLRASDMDLFA